MFKELMFLAALTVLTASSPVSHVFEIDISPEEAQKYLNSPPFTDPQLSTRTAVLPLVRWDSPSFRAAEAGPTIGHYWKNGKEIENTGDYDEEVYDASQYHGQDGLGAYAYGYQGPDSSKVENRVHSGDVTGSYTYKAGNDLIKVRYWADSQGFHQEDNIPKVVLEPVQEAEDVRQARLAHEKAWQEAAAAAAQQPDPQGEYNSQYDQGAQYQGAASEQQSTVVAPAPAPAQASEAREGKAYFAQAQSSFQSGQQGQLRAQNQGQYSQQGQFSAQGQGQQGQYGQLKAQSQAYQGQQGQQAYAQAQFSGAQQGQYSGAQGQQSGAQGQGSGAQDGQYQPKEDEEQGPPRGFFYSFNYPVSVIVAKNAGQGGQVQPGHPIDHDTVGITSQH